MNFSNLLFSCLVVIGCSGLSGCATTRDGANAGKVGLEQLMSDSMAASANGLPEKSMDLLEKAAKEFPTRKEPWLRIAQLHFEAHDYGQAILSAEEVLERDEKDQLAKSILAVSGLRVSARALAKLREDQVITGDVRLEARMLAKTLRETLGESDLFSGKTVGEGGGASVDQGRKTPVVKRVVKPTVPPVTTPSAGTKTGASDVAPKSGSGDPFGALK